MFLHPPWPSGVNLKNVEGMLVYYWASNIWPLIYSLCESKMMRYYWVGMLSVQVQTKKKLQITGTFSFQTWNVHTCAICKSSLLPTVVPNSLWVQASVCLSLHSEFRQNGADEVNGACFLWTIPCPLRSLLQVWVALGSRGAKSVGEERDTGCGDMTSSLAGRVSDRKRLREGGGGKRANSFYIRGLFFGVLHTVSHLHTTSPTQICLSSPSPSTL